MKDCDRVFEMLTQSRGDKSGDYDSLVLPHLKECSSCRALADSIGPAVELFHASAETNGSGAVGASRIAAGVNRRIKQRGIVMTYSVSLLLLIGIFSTLHGAFSESTMNVPDRLSVGYATHAPESPMPDRQLLAALDLPVGCYAEPQSSGELPQCCTECHSSAASAHLNQAFAVFISSCSACHGLN